MHATRIDHLVAGFALCAVAVSIASWREPAPLVVTQARPADLERDEIRRAVQEQFVPAARRCYEELLRRDPIAEGRVTLRFGIVADGDCGRVDRCEVVDADSDLPDPRFRGCVVDAMKAVIFAAPRSGRVEVVYPILFRPAAGVAIAG
ncbi:MAG TPA: AgmX/PglI C-terminal domain-containing protein [Nannocystaceae bacterium]|nr:AgmX/PglI C-terminal domain-containing protein [Nannocystaceae bacterium]